jgi:hypothetical protein
VSVPETAPTRGHKHRHDQGEDGNLDNGG